ncbi:MAG: hypothetical protein ACI4ET_11345 [Bilifractor sp.]
MDKKSIKEKFFSGSRHLWVVVITVIVTFIALQVIIVQLRNQTIEGIDYQSDAIGEIVHSDGTVESNLSSDRWTVRGGDCLTIVLQLPHNAPYKDSALVFHQYNSVVKVMIDGRTVYSYGQNYADRKRQIGNLQVVIPIDDDDWGKEVTITADVQERFSSLHQTEMMIMPSALAQ